MKLYEALLTTMVGVAAAGCDSACEDANAKLDGECKDEIARAHRGQGYSALPISGGSQECTNDERCVAVCILDADCPAIAAVMATGGAQIDPNAPNPVGTAEFRSCVEGCIFGSDQP